MAMAPRRFLVLAFSVLALVPAGTSTAAAAPPPTARAITAEGATLVGPVPAKAHGPVHFSWRVSGGPWRGPAPRRTRSRRVTVRLAGLRPATTYRFRLVADRRATRSALFTTLPPRPSRTAGGQTSIPT